jgi:soluble lytic murein transglycosylase-like protein
LIQQKREIVNQGEKVKNKNFSEMLDEKVDLLNKPYGLYENGDVTRKDLYKIVDYYSKQTGLPASLVHSLVIGESDYNIEELSPKGAMGLGQLMPQMTKGLGNVLDLYIGDEK